MPSGSSKKRLFPHATCLWHAGHSIMRIFGGLHRPQKGLHAQHIVRYRLTKAKYMRKRTGEAWTPARHRKLQRNRGKKGITLHGGIYFSAFSSV